MRYLIGISAALAILAGVWLHGNSHGHSIERLEWQGLTAAATERARATEQERQEAINHAIQKQYDDLADINAGLLTDLDGLRNHAPRRSVPDDSRTDCQGTSGAALARPDAGFLTRKATDHDIYRAGLIACYAYADALKQ